MSLAHAAACAGQLSYVTALPQVLRAVHKQRQLLFVQAMFILMLLTHQLAAPAPLAGRQAAALICCEHPVPLLPSAHAAVEAGVG
jgi:hypothetical protein